MTRPPLEYLAWAMANYASVRFDLASSGVPAVAVTAFASADEVAERLHDPNSASALRAAIARRFSVDPAHVVATLGTSHAIWATYAAILEPGDRVHVERTVYEPLERVAQGLGGEVVAFDRALDRLGAIDVEALERQVDARSKLIVVTNPHNPTGAWTDDATLARIAAIAARVGARLLVNEVYRERLDRPEFSPFRATTSFGLAPNVTVIGSLTKVFGLGWARVGWIVTEPEVAARALEATLHASAGMSPISASIGVLALERLGRIADVVRTLRDHDEEAGRRIDAWVHARAWASLDRHPGSIFGFVRDRRGHDLRPSIERAIADERVIVAPGVFFGEPSGFRIRYGATALDVLDEGLARLARVLD